MATPFRQNDLTFARRLRKAAVKLCRRMLALETSPALPKPNAQLREAIARSVRPLSHGFSSADSEALLENRTRYVLQSRPRLELGRYAPEIRAAAGELLHRLEELRSQWNVTPATERNALLQEAARVTGELQGRDLTQIPLRVAAREFIKGALASHPLLLAAAEHLKQTAELPAHTLARTRANERAHAIER